MLRIFLSHLRDDGVLARRLAEALRRAGHQPVLVEDETRVGDTALSVLERSLRDADVGVLCLSRAAQADAWMQTEFQTVLSQFEAHRKPVLVARFDWAQIKGSVAQKPAVDLFPGAGGWDGGLSSLLEVVRRVDEGGLKNVWPLLLGAPPLPEHFVDREEVLRQLHEALDPQRGQSGGQRATLIGPGGIGKTAIALRFAHDSAESFPGGVWWCWDQARTPEEELARLFWKMRHWAPLAIRAPLDSVSPDTPTPELARAVRQVLEGVREPALLIVHDAVDQDWGDFLPGPPVHVLMMSRRRQGAVGRQITVEPLPVSAAVQLVEALTGVPKDPQEAEARLRFVSEMAEGSPFALTLAAHLYKKGMSWGEIEQMLRIRVQEEVLRGAGERHPQVLDAVFSLLTPSMREVVEVVASFAAAPVLVEWVRALAKDDVERQEFDKSIGKLRSLGLLNWHGAERALSLHPPVRQWVRERTPTSRHEQLSRKILEVIESWLRPRLRLLSPEQVDEFDAYVPHFLETLEETSSQPPSQEWVRLARGISDIFTVRAEYRTALKWLELALSQAEQLQNTLQELSCLVELAINLHLMGWEERAAAYVRRALPLVDMLPMKPERDLILALNMLAVLLLKGDAERAKRLSEQASQLAESAPEVDDADKAMLLSTLALATVMVDGDVASVTLFQRALGIVERRFGQESYHAAQITAGLAAALIHVGDLARAKALMERAIAISERLLPPDHPNLARWLRDLAVILMQMGEIASARPLLERALVIEEAKIGPEHPALAYTLHYLGVVLLALEKAQEAEAMLSRAAALAEAGLSPDDPTLASIWFALAAAAGYQGNQKAAGVHLARALDTGMALYLPEPGSGLQPLNRALRLARGRQVNPEAYVSALGEAIELAEQGSDVSNAAKAALLLGAFEGRRGAWETARKYVERGLRLSKHADDLILIAESHRLLGDASLHGSRYEDARLHYAEAIRRLDELGLQARAARVRMLLLVMMLQLGRTEGLAEHAAALKAMLKEGKFTEPAERSEVEQILRLADAAHPGAPPEPQGNTE